MENHESSFPVERDDLIRIAIVAGAAPVTWFHLWQPLQQVDILAVIVILVGGYPIYQEAFEALRERRMTMELSMTIALVAALAIGEYFTTLMIVLFVLIAEVLEHLTVERGRQAVKQLLELLPRQVVLRRNGEAVTVDTSTVQPGDVVVIHPGSRIPVDGEVVEGHSFVDQAAITGESMPVEKVGGAPVYAGSINQSGVLEVRTAQVGADTSFGKIIQAVEEAENSRAPVQKMADRFAGYLVYFALACAVATYFTSHDIRSTISVIIVAGACGIAAGTPLAILGAIGQAAARGAIVKGGLWLEILSSIDTVVLDKTGTLTLGVPTVTDILPTPGGNAEALLRTAAIAEQSSEHPLGKAIVSRAGQTSSTLPPLQTFSYTPGQGIVCTSAPGEIVVGNRGMLSARGISLTDAPEASRVGSDILVALDGRLLGAIHVQDVTRPEANAAMQALQDLGVSPILLTGDNRATASALAENLGIREIEADMLPQQKLEYVKKLMAQGKKVAMVGDGINDAPALMQASVGVAMGSGTEVARESAGIVLLGNDLVRFVDTLKIARRCRGIITANFVGTLVVDAIGVGLAAFGFLNPLLAVFIHVSSELTFILNSARLLPARRPASLVQATPAWQRRGKEDERAGSPARTLG